MKILQKEISLLRNLNSKFPIRINCKTPNLWLLSLILIFAEINYSYAQNFVETDIVVSSDIQSGDAFGRDVRLDGDQAIIGVPDSDDAGSRSGSAYIFEKNVSGDWVQVQKLLASDDQSEDRFGAGVDISGDYAIVGSFFEDEAGSNAGAAYIFEKNGGGTWVQVQKILGSDTSSSDRFGWEVKLSGTTAIVSATHNSSEEGNVYVFERNGSGTWLEVQKLGASNASSLANFGHSINMNGDEIIVSAHHQNVAGTNSGMVYVFEKNGSGTWVETATLANSDGEANDEFGISVSIENGIAVVGAPNKDLTAGDDNSGIVYVFEKNGSGNYVETEILTASNAAASNFFGSDIEIDNGTIAIGTIGTTHQGTNTGSAYIFAKNICGDWAEVQIVNASDASAEAYFGWRVDIEGDELMVGAVFEDGNGTNAGKVYFFEDNSIPPTPIATPSMTISLPSGTSASENNSNALTYRFTRSASNVCDLTVYFSIDGSATAAIDYSLSSSGAMVFELGDNIGSIVIPANQTTIDLIVTPISESLVESNEIIGVKIEPAP